jgi:GH25 family lysozyme M1 (1,4-beta-N-acetylmuramidase)
MKNLYSYFILIILSVFLLNGCAFQTSTDEKRKIDLQTEEKNNTESENLHFVDAGGEWHDVAIDTDIAGHDYDWSFLSNDGQNISYEGDDNYTIQKGIDVSYHQGTIDWEKVKAAGYEFVILRIAYRGYGSEGKLCIDSAFYTYLEGAQSAGLDVGVYIFSQAINEKEAEEEADLVIEALSGIKLSLPVVFDPELIKDDTARTDDVTGEQFTKNALTFCEKIKNAGYRPMIYSNMFWEAYMFNLKQLSEYQIWYADYEQTPQTPYAFTFWQYSESGQVPGIEGNCDLDIRFVKK